MRAKKLFYVIAYDIADDRRRYRIVKAIEKYGVRINYSVYECMVTPAQLKNIQQKINLLIEKQEDTVVYYPICMNCYTKIIYQPESRKPAAVTIVI